MSARLILLRGMSPRREQSRIRDHRLHASGVGPSPTQTWRATAAKRLRGPSVRDRAVLPNRSPMLRMRRSRTTAEGAAEVPGASQLQTTLITRLCAATIAIKESYHSGGGGNYVSVSFRVYVYGTAKEGR